MKRLRGLTELLQDTVDKGAMAIHKVHRDLARRPFEVLQKIPTFSDPAHAAQRIHDAILDQTYDSIRLANRLLHVAADATIAVVEAREREEE